MKSEIIQPLNWAEVEFGITGLSPLIVQAWNDKARRQLRMTAAERRKMPKEAHNPEEEALAGCYYTEDGEFGVPMLAVKACLIGAAHKDLGLEKTLARKAIWLPGDPSSVWPLQYESNHVREDIVRVGNQQTSMRYRMQFDGWSVRAKLNLLVSDLTPRDLAVLLQRAGLTIGICEWRPEKGGDFGRFDISKEAMVVTPLTGLTQAREAA